MESLKRIDMFRKPREDLERESVCGGILSLLTIATISLLASLFLVDLDSQRLVKQVRVRSGTDSNQFDVNIDITFMNSPCDTLSIEKRDLVNREIVNIRSGIVFERLTQAKHDLIWKEYVDPELKSRYPKSDLALLRTLTGLKDREQCRVTGTFVASKIPGRVTFTNKKDTELIRAVFAADPELYRRMNLAHAIGRLSFGSLDTQRAIVRSFIRGADTEFSRARGTIYDVPGQYSCYYYLRVIQNEFPLEEARMERELGGGVYKYSYHQNCLVSLFTIHSATCRQPRTVPRF